MINVIEKINCITDLNLVCSVKEKGKSEYEGLKAAIEKYNEHSIQTVNVIMINNNGEVIIPSKVHDFNIEYGNIFEDSEGEYQVFFDLKLVVDIEQIEPLHIQEVIVHALLSKGEVDVIRVHDWEI